MKKNQKAFGSMIDHCQILIGLPVQLLGYLAYLIFPPPDQTHIPHKSSILRRILRRKVLNFKSVSIFAIFIVLISIFTLNINYLKYLNNIYDDDCLICDTGYDSMGDVSDLSIYDVYHAASNDFIIVIASTKNLFFNPHVLAYKISTRAPPV